MKIAVSAFYTSLLRALLCLVAMLCCIYVQAEMKYAVSGGVVDGTAQWNIRPTDACIFSADGTDRWVLTFTFKDLDFKILAKENGTSSEDWPWDQCEVKNITTGKNMTGGGGNNLNINNFSEGETLKLVLTKDASGNYNIYATKDGLFITASPASPIEPGVTSTLTADNVTAVCTWEYSTDGGTTWNNYTDATSGTYGETITVTPTDNTYYKVTSGAENATYEMIVAEHAFAVTGGVVSGTAEWNTSPPAQCIFTSTGTDEWELCFIYDTKEFKLLTKQGGLPNENWGWEAQLNEIDNGTNVNGCCGGNMSLSNFNAGDAVCLTLTKKDDGRYLLSASKGMVIEASKENPITQGDELSLTAAGATGICTWEYSYDEITWQPYTGSSSGTYNEVISPTPIVATYYRANDGSSMATYRVQVIIKCSGDSQKHVNETFGVLSSATARKQDANVPASYIFSPEGYEVHDGFYAVVANPRGCGQGSRTTPEGCHASDCLGKINPDSQGNYWYIERTDHTGDTNGGMLLLNCNNRGEVMYSSTHTGLCKNIYMTFSAWFASASYGNPIKTRFQVLDKNGKEITTARFDVDAISVEDGWKQGQTTFFSGENDELTIQIVNNGASGSGNDILVDDIMFSSCIPQLTIQPGIDVICGDASTLKVESEGIEQIFGTVPYYLWQMLDENDTDPATMWHDIADDPVPGRESHGGSGVDKVEYDYKTSVGRKKPQFRVIMSSDPDVAKKVGHNIFPVCNVYAETKIAIVDCGCVTQTLTPGDDEQTVCGGESITSLTFQASGEKTTGINYKDLPTGLNANISGTTLTISGKAPSVSTDQTYITKVFAVGVPDVACESDTLKFTLNVKPTPDAPSVKY